MERYIDEEFTIDVGNIKEDLADLGIYQGQKGRILSVAIEGEKFKDSNFNVELEDGRAFRAVSGSHLILKIEQ